MLSVLRNSRRLPTAGRILERSGRFCPNLSSPIRCKSENVVVTIANVSKEVRPASNPEYVPRKYLLNNHSQEALKHLRWMLQKDVLRQDMFLMGGPGTRRRELAFAFLELTGRELEFIALTRDTTEADLKQRREIKSGTAYYHDQSAVRAATNGRVLLIEGVEKAERNVLPVLNNLLENREMHLEDGRFLIPASRYDKLLKIHTQAELDKWRLVRVSEDFIVIALGLPSPRYPGHPLDPPLRSRFQARHIPPPTFEEQFEALRNLAPNVDAGKLSQLLSCAHALVTQEAVTIGLPDFPLDNLSSAALIMDKSPDLSVYDVFYRFYPYKLFLGKEGQNAVEDILGTFSVLSNSKTNCDIISKVDSTKKADDLLEISIKRNNSKTSFHVPCGMSQLSSSANNDHYIETNYQNNLLASMLESHLASDFCLIGPKGCGKSTTVRRLADLLGYQVEPIVLYQDMTSRDLIQQRTTSLNGDTVWRDSPLVDAALHGKLAVLDGINRIHSSTLAILHRLVHNRELQLHDGKRLIRADRYDEIKKEYNRTDEEMRDRGVLRIHPAFRLIALAEPPVVNSSSGQWLNSELLSLLLFHEMRPLDKREEIHIIRSKFGEPSQALLSIVELAHVLRSSNDPTLLSLAGSLSTRQLLRIAERMHRFRCDDAYNAVQRACLARFLPAIAKEALEDSCRRLGIVPPKSTADSTIEYSVTEDSVKIGDTVVDRYRTAALSKVPDIVFYDVPEHVALLERLLQDFSLGQNLLLVGNQGVGKNKIVDRLLQLLNKPREYIQLHRDTTVQTLTLQPMVRDGKVVYEDSPLVQAVKLGHVLVVDEADKAPTHVTCILKTLVESGEMILSDGRRIVPRVSGNARNANSIPMHPDFRMIVLANRPGFPFLGNDFFGALGDLFSTHSIDNPSIRSEIQLLKQYGPHIDERTIHKLVKAFGELRSMADQGLVSYPYSTREVVNIVKHLEKFPNEPLSTVVRNVFDFDRYSQEIFDTLVTVLHKHGIPVGTSPTNVALAKEIPLPEMKVCGSWNVSSTFQNIPVQERYVKLKPPTFPAQYDRTLDRVEARSAWFTELQSYWTIPISENSTVTALAVANGNKGDGTDDRIHVLTSNPLSLFSMTPDSEQIRETSLQGLISPVRGNMPFYNVAVDNLGDVLVHEQTSNSVLVVNVNEDSVRELQFSTFLDVASDRISSAFRNRNFQWQMKADLLQSHNLIVLYTQDHDKIEVINLQSMCAYSMSLPCNIESILLASDRKWLIQSASKDKYVLTKSSDSDPCPNVLRELDESNSVDLKTGTVLNCGRSSLHKTELSKALQQKIDCPNRLLVTDNTYAGIATGFPDLDSSNELHFWPRRGRTRSFITPIVMQNGQVIRTVSPSLVPDEVYPKDTKHAGISGYLEIVDMVNHKLRYIPIPEPVNVSPLTQWLYAKDFPLYASLTSNEGLVTIDAGGCVRLWETSITNIEKSLGAWRQMIGAGEEKIQITKERYSGQDVSGPKHGKVDKSNEPHVGGNTWAGGTGGRDTAGLGGKGGPYRLDAGHTVHQLSDEEKNAVPEHVKKAAREMGLRAFKQRLKDIKMSEYDHKLYTQFSDAIHNQVQALRVILGSLQAKSNERQWCRHQTSGELDDTKLIEGLTGEKTIYRRRAEKEPEIGAPQLKPKRLKLVADVSGSMYRFNGYDGRLDRELEACVMVMEAFSGYEGKFQYDIVGHSGDDYRIVFVDRTQPPTDNKRRLEVIKTMHAHSQFCMSGDNTLQATQHAIASLAKEDSDESIVVVLSDANLDRYGISPKRFAKLLMSNADVNAYAIFIGSLGDQATRLMKEMPSGRAFVCMDLKNIPRILQQIFAASVLSTTRST
ncbi:von Willebrand factor A domain-containing protein 8 isoform X1 [Solenopsis invicta]|uniref:von Willebrand factor A domain-containing protein 8 isoform X1 n=1 Tax=Solenopsis invicta TaxID=13686 RepID=UPI00193DDE35|nr:von Willebrand factor A domain-containing protein 8 isoform X1 [Solenopsis invicta]XP_011166751.2 von Willebrand factor A domain-containing protein 8 isoform X1 [Solenopsis invicta]XP_011166752.2 von Willebrand factor A domain-containing protein 8 isoform X1 [Solenopsis invicta]